MAPLTDEDLMDDLGASRIGGKFKGRMDRTERVEYRGGAPTMDSVSTSRSMRVNTNQDRNSRWDDKHFKTSTLSSSKGTTDNQEYQTY